MMIDIILNNTGGAIMESLELRIFREVAYTKSISKTAENMGYVQSNITAHIKKLEGELNTTLFIRHSKGVTLTKDGEKLLYQAEKIISLLDKTLQSFQNNPKTLKIGTTQTIAGYLLPKCIIEYQKQFPNVSLSVSTLNQDDLDHSLYNGLLDCIITNSTHNITQGRRILEFQDNLMLATPCSCNSINDIFTYPIIINNIKSCPYRKALLDWWNLHQSKSPMIIELDTVEAILNTVAMGGGISLLPKYILADKQNINSFYIEDLQYTSIHMWIAMNKLTSEYFTLKDILKKQFKIDNN